MSANETLDIDRVECGVRSALAYAQTRSFIPSVLTDAIIDAGRLIAAVRERDAEIARLTALLAARSVGLVQVDPPVEWDY